jgi:hypothetical protein
LVVRNKRASPRVGPRTGMMLCRHENGRWHSAGAAPPNRSEKMREGSSVKQGRAINPTASFYRSSVERGNPAKLRSSIVCLRPSNSDSNRPNRKSEPFGIRPPLHATATTPRCEVWHNGTAEAGFSGNSSAHLVAPVGSARFDNRRIVELVFGSKMRPAGNSEWALGVCPAWLRPAEDQVQRNRLQSAPERAT